MLNLLESLVSIPGTTTGYGLIKYIGPIRGKVGVFAGLELDSSIAALRGRNNGDVEGVQYFDVSIAGAGLFLPWDRLRALNPHLPANVRSLSRASSGQEQIGTPSPGSRGIKSRVSSSMGSTDRSSFGRDSPLLAAPKLQVPKRRASTKDLHRPAQQNTTRAVSLSTVSSSLLDVNAEKIIDALRSELTDAKALLDLKNRALLEKTAILDDLQSTVNELNPILQDYEAAVAEKERKMQKQKHDYESAREEWRQSLELMLNAQLETELLYELEIADLKQEIAALINKSSAPPKSPSKHRLVELERRIKQLTDENEKLRSQATVGNDSDRDDAELYILQIKELEKDAEDARQELALTHTALKKAEKELEASKAEIASLKACQVEMEKKIEDELAQRLESMTMEGSGKSAGAIEHAISDKTDTSLCSEELNNIKEQVEILTKDLTEKNLVQALRIKELERDLQNAIDSRAPRSTDPGTSNGLSELQEAQALISELKHQLEMRPSFEELTELQNSMDEVDSLHQKELQFQADQIARLQKECDDLKALALKSEQSQTIPSKVSNTTSNNILNEHSLLGSSIVTLVAASLPLYTVEGDIVAKPLDVHIPAQIIDASAGRDNWCGLCEREGHSSLECPYENDMF